MKFILIICFLAASCMSKTQNNNKKANPTNHKQLDSLFSKLHADGKLNGNVLIARGDTVVYHNSFGVADHRTNRKLNDSSIFELASVSKQFTAMGIVLLKEKGKLKYEDSLRHFFPELPFQGVTIKHLLHHTSGLPDYMDPLVLDAKSGAIATNSDLIALLAKGKLKAVFNPGEKWEYSNTGYALLASIIEKVSGKSFGDFLKENIFLPLGMLHTQIYRRRYEKREVENYALGYIKDKDDKSWILPDSVFLTAGMVTALDGIVGDGTVNSTALDLLKWSLALDKNLLVSKAVQSEIFTPGALNSGEKHSYGYGWMTGTRKNIGSLVNHGGGWPGYGTLIEKHLDKGVTIIILNNHDQPQIPYGKLINILYGIKEEAKVETKADESLLRQYIGKYELSPDFVITISVENGKIYEQATGQARLEIFPWKEDLFFLKAVEAEIRFERNDKKEITSLVLLQNGREIQGKKLSRE